MSLPIRARLTLWYVALFAVVLGALGVFLAVRLRADLVSELDQSLETRAAQITLGLRSGCEGEFQDVSESSLFGLPRGESGAQLLAPDGSVSETSGDPAAAVALLPAGRSAQVMSGSAYTATIRTGADGEPFRVLAVRLPAGACPGAIVVATSLDDIDASLHRLALLLGVAGPVGLVAAGGGGWWLARRALAPVDRMTRQAESIGIERLDERVAVPSGSDELGRLALTLNEMLDRLERGVEDKKRFAADASHELRTPLAVMQSELEVALRAPDLDPVARDVLESSVEEVGRMSAVVENLLMIARADNGSLALLRSDVDLRRIAERVVATSEPLARKRAVRLLPRGPSAIVNADPARIEQVVGNLVHNAIRHSPPAGVVTISTWVEADGVGATVQDEGDGVPPGLKLHVFERFVSGKRANDGGAGLGLAIAREIVLAHGGLIWLDSDASTGGVFSFWLPVDGRLSG